MRVWLVECDWWRVMSCGVWLVEGGDYNAIFVPGHFLRGFLGVGFLKLPKGVGGRFWGVVFWYVDGWDCQVGMRVMSRTPVWWGESYGTYTFVIGGEWCRVHLRYLLRCCLLGCLLRCRLLGCRGYPLGCRCVERSWWWCWCWWVVDHGLDPCQVAR